MYLVIAALIAGVAGYSGSNLLYAGLGLTVARDTIRAHEGNVTIESTAGAGTRVTLTLPTKRA